MKTSKMVEKEAVYTEEVAKDGKEMKEVVDGLKEEETVNEVWIPNWNFSRSEYHVLTFHESSNSSKARLSVVPIRGFMTLQLALQ